MKKKLLVLLVILGLLFSFSICAAETKSFYIVYIGKPDDATYTVGGDVVWLEDGVHFEDINRMMRHVEAANPNLSNVVILGWYEIKDYRVKKGDVK
jgi:hypothetical protein